MFWCYTFGVNVGAVKHYLRHLVCKPLLQKTKYNSTRSTTLLCRVLLCIMKLIQSLIPETITNLRKCLLLHY